MGFQGKLGQNKMRAKETENSRIPARGKGFVFDHG